MNVGSRKPGRRFSLSRSGEGVVCAPVVNQYVRICETQGIPRAAMLAEAGISESELNPPDGWVRQAAVERLFHARLQRWPDPLLGLHFATAMEPAMAGMLGFMALSCPSVLDLHTTLHNFGGLVSNILSTSLIHEPGLVLWAIDFSYTDEAVSRHSTEWVLAAFAALVNRLDPHALLEVRMTHAPCLFDGAPHPDYARAFSCPVKFRQPRAVLVLDPHRASKASPNGDPLVFETLCQQARLLLEQMGTEHDIRDRVRREIRVLLAEGRASREEVCRRIGISSRHLHRQLQLHDSSYQMLLDEWRIEAAQQQVMRPDCDLDKVSNELGFGSSKSFARWFTGKMGATPSEYRRRIQPRMN